MQLLRKSVSEVDDCQLPPGVGTRTNVKSPPGVWGPPGWGMKLTSTLQHIRWDQSHINIIISLASSNTLVVQEDRVFILFISWTGLV